MKHLKRRVRSALCAALCLALGAALVPFAAAEDAVDTYIGEISGPPISMAAVDDPNAPIITKQPFSETRYVQNGKSFEMRVEAQLPEGVKGELSYAWYKYVSDGNYELVGVGATATIQTEAFDVSNLTYSNLFGRVFAIFEGGQYCVVVTNHYQDAEGNAHTAGVGLDEWIRVRQLPNMSGFMMAMVRHSFSGLLGVLLALPLLPFYGLMLIPMRSMQSRAERAYQQYWAS